MRMMGGFSQEIKVYRKAGGQTLNQWGDRADTNPVPEIPFLQGYEFSHDFFGTIAGRATDEIARTPQHARLNDSSMTLYCDVVEDIQSEDVVVYVNPAGRQQAFRVQGDTDMDYVSPYTGMIGGKEVFLHRFTKERS